MCRSERRIASGPAHHLGTSTHVVLLLLLLLSRLWDWGKPRDVDINSLRAQTTRLHTICLVAGQLCWPSFTSFCPQTGHLAAISGRGVIVERVPEFAHTHNAIPIKIPGCGGP